jgi:hypothetical protein
MNADLAQVFPAITLFVISIVLTASCLWVAGKLTPWFTGTRSDTPTVRSYFLEPAAEQAMNRTRLVTLTIAAALLLAILLTMAIAVRFGGMALL